MGGTVLVMLASPAVVTWLPATDIHLASATIIATAFALVLTVSLVPAQRAADVFSSAILKLYQRDPLFTVVFLLLSLFAIGSLFLATGMTLGLAERDAVALQVLMLGIALDLVRAFYRRSLDLLLPEQALSRVQAHCSQLIKSHSRRVDRVAKAVTRAGTTGAAREDSVMKWQLHAASGMQQALGSWVSQLEEFGHKAIARKDVQAAKIAVRVLAAIARQYADSRRESLVLILDLREILAPAQSEASQLLNTIFEAIRRLSDHSVPESEEGVAAACVTALGELAAHLMTITSSQNGMKRAPLAYSAIYYLGVCLEPIGTAKMPDAVLAAIRSSKGIFNSVDADLDAQTEETQTLETLFKAAQFGYLMKIPFPAYEAMTLMLAAAREDLRLRGETPTSHLKTVLKYAELLLPLEIFLQKIGKTSTQGFPAYAIGSQVNLPAILASIIRRVQIDEERPWVDPFHELENVCEVIVKHYQGLTEALSSNGLTRIWVTKSLFDCIDLLVELVSGPPSGSESFLQTVTNQIAWLVNVPTGYFSDAKIFKNYQMLSEVTDRTAIAAMELLQTQSPEAALDCCKALAALARRSESLGSSRYSTADILTSLEVVARAAGKLGFKAIESQIRDLQKLEIEDPERAALVEDARLNRIGHMQNRLDSHSRHWDRGPTDVLRKILGQPRVPQKLGKERKRTRQVVEPEKKARIQAIFRAKHYQPLSMHKISGPSGIPEHEVKVLLHEMGAQRRQSREGTEMWQLLEEE